MEITARTNIQIPVSPLLIQPREYVSLALANPVQNVAPLLSDQRLPPMNALRAFEAAARLGSIKLAGAELCVTPAAVSQQIRKLEDCLSVSLFVRGHNQIVLTEDGRALSDCMTSALQDMRSTIRNIRNRNAQGEVVVTSAPMFFNKFVGPRLWEFKRENPDVHLRIELGLDPRLFDKEEAALGIVLPDAEVPGTECSENYWEYQAPMASPQYLRANRIEKPEDLYRAVLLERAYPVEMPGIPSWRDWFAEAGLDFSAEQKVMSFGPHYEQIYDAVLNDIGVFLGGVGVGSKLLESGRLVCPFGPLMPQGTGVKVVWSPSISGNRKALRFRDWLLGEMQDVTRTMLNREVYCCAG